MSLNKKNWIAILLALVCATSAWSQDASSEKNNGAPDASGPAPMPVATKPTETVLAPSTAAESKGPHLIEIILDASGSMLQPTKGETKIETAKKMIGAFIKSTETDGSLVGLRTFGHRKSRDCKDIELKLGFYPKDVKELTKIMNGIQPKERAMTPLAKAMEQSYENLKKQEGDRKLVVITDGKDTCGGDPCKIAKKIERDLNVKIYLVAYGVTDRKKFRELQCIGDTLGNKAPDGIQSLSDQLAAIRRDIKGTQQAIVVQGPDPAAWAVAKSLAPDGREFRFIASQGIELQPGKYKVTVEYPVPYVVKEVELKKRQIKVIKVGGLATLFPQFFHEQMTFTVTDLESSKAVEVPGSQIPFKMAASRYLVTARTPQGLAYQWPPLVASPGEKIRLSSPPWGVFIYKSADKKPYRIYSEGARKSQPIPPVNAKGTPVALKKITAEREPVGTALTNAEILLEEGIYAIVFNDETIESGIKIKRGKTTTLPVK